MTRLPLILADDLTGAADCAARCRQAGLPATVFLGQPRAPLPDGVSAFTTDSRHLAPNDAARRVRGAVAPFGGLGVLWYKKIDSTLRGNIGAELEAMLDALQRSTQRRPFAVVSPAFPAQRRGLRNGRLVMEGGGATPALLERITGQASALRMGVINLSIVRSTRATLARALRRSCMSDDLAIVDAMNESDLEEIVAALEEVAPNALRCGSAGLMGVWARRLALQYPELTTPSSCSPLPVGGVLAVIGSGSPAAQRQIAAVLKAEMAQPLLLERQTDPRVIAEVASPASGRWLLHLPPPAAHEVLDGAAARSLAVHLAEAATAVIERVEPRRLILSGGDTALCVLQRLGMQQLKVMREVAPGMPLATGDSADGRQWQIILKAGNHGDEQTLASLFEW